MKRLRMLLIASALMAGGTALASAQPRDHDDRYRDRDDRHSYRDRDDRYRDRDERHFDRDDWRARRSFDRDDHRYYAGERRFVNGYYWTWDGGRWCRRDGRVTLYLGF
jgi:Ni/Co efflux regulator RcnB